MRSLWIAAMLCTTASAGDALDATWRAVCQVESGGNPLAHNAGEDARGIAQIRAVMIRDVNRYSKEQFVHEDAWNAEKSKRIFRAYCEHYSPNGTPETWAKMWNGGPKGPQKKSTLVYWVRVKSRMEK